MTSGSTIPAGGDHDHGRWRMAALLAATLCSGTGAAVAALTDRFAAGVGLVVLGLFLVVGMAEHGGTPCRPRLRRCRRWALAATCALTVLAAVEVGLRGTAAAWVWWQRRAEPGSGDRTVLCCGDSNTFGIWMDDAGTYPAQLAELLAAHAPGRFRVVNSGVPGINTWSILAHLADDLQRHRPAVVVLLAGINDRWGRPPEPGLPEPPLERLRLVRLLRLLAEPAHAALGEAVHARMRDGKERAFQVGGAPLADDAAALTDQVRGDLIQAVAMVRAHGALPILATYGADAPPFVPVNAAIRAAAAATQTRILDPARVFRTEPAIPRERLLLADHHMNREGYGVLARLVLLALVDEQLVDAHVDPDPLVQLRGAARRPTVAVHRDDAGALVVQARFLPGYDCRLLLAGEARVGSTAWGAAIPLDADAVFSSTCRRSDLGAAFDAHGSAQLTLGAAVRAACGARVVRAVVLAVRFADTIPGHPPEEVARYPEAPAAVAYVGGVSSVFDLDLR